MTEPVKQDEAPIIVNDGGKAPVTAPPADEEAWWKEASEKHGFKSKEDVYKSWSNANQKISDQGDEIKNYKTFQDTVVPVLDVVLKDEELLGKVRAKMENPNLIIPPKPAPPIDNKVVTPPEDTDTKKYLVGNAVEKFEQSHGIDKLDPETKKEVQAKIGIEFRKFTAGKEPKVSEMSEQLNDAFALAVAKDSKLAGIFAPKEDAMSDYGSMPSQSSGIDRDGNIRLTPEQEKVAQNMPGGREAYIKGIKKIQAK